MFMHNFYFFENNARLHMSKTSAKIGTHMKALLYILPLVAMLASCSTTPATRIQRNPEIYAKLSPKHKELVRQGKITRGMRPPAVFLAMGHPDSQSAGIQHGKRFERWHYNVLVPVYSYGFSPYYGYGRYGCHHGGYWGYGIQPSVHYVPRHGATVEFRRGKVTGWSAVRRNY